jgi:hypothetical protein
VPRTTRSYYNTDGNHSTHLRREYSSMEGVYYLARIGEAVRAGKATNAVYGHSHVAAVPTMLDIVVALLAYGKCCFNIVLV